MNNIYKPEDFKLTQKTLENPDDNTVLVRLMIFPKNQSSDNKICIMADTIFTKLIFYNYRKIVTNCINEKKTHLKKMIVKYCDWLNKNKKNFDPDTYNEFKLNTGEI